MTQNSNKINFWRGTRFVFERKIQRGELVTGTVYFVGNSMEDVEGTGQSTYGVIYQAVSENRAVRYGIFATDDDITRLIEELTEKIDEEGEERREADDQLSERIAHLIPEVADAVENHMAIFDSDGRLKDSGRDIVEFLMDGDIDDATIKFENGKLVVQDYSHKHHISDVDGLRGELDTKIGTEKMGTSNGIATLDENAKVNLEQIPYTDGYGIDITGAGEIKTEPISDAEIDAMNAGERNGHLLDNLGLVRLWNRIVSFFVQKEEGKGLSSNDYTDAEKDKLAGIESGAEVNVQSDWNQTNTSADDYIKNKPSVYIKTEIDQMLTGNVKREIVSELPQTGVDGTIYMVPSATAATGDVYDEYMWLSTQGQVAAHFEKIGTTKADLANYYTKSEVDTALGNKQASITITNNTSTPADNDTVIMQASGTTNTTSFLRRTMSKIWDYIKSKADAIYWLADKVELNIPSSLNRKKKILSSHTNDTFYALNERYPVTWKTYTTETDELYEDNASRIPKLFNGHLEDVYGHPLTGEYDIVEMDFTGASGGYFPPSYTASGGAEAYLTLHFRGSFPEQTPKVEYCVPDSATWVEVSGESINDNTFKIFAYKINAKLAKLRITVIGRTGGESNPSYKGASIANIFFMSGRGRGVEQYDIVTKYKFKQDLYGEVEAPKFTMRGGTSQQVLLANGTTINMPSTTGTNKDTLLKNLVSGLSVPSSDVTDTMEIVTSSSGIDGFGTSGQVNVPFKRRMTKVWDYIKSKADLVYSTITETNKKANRIIDHTWNQPSYSASAGGTHVKICDIPSDCVCVMNVRKSVYGYPSINTLWIGNNNSLDFKSLTETDIVATVSSRVCTLSVPAHTSSGTPLHTYDFEISVLNKENLSAITWYDDATYYSPSRPTKPNIVMQQSAPVTDGSLAFSVNSSTHVASVSVDGYTDFVGMLTEDSTSAVLVKLSDEAEGSVYRFTFDHAIEGGVSFSNSNASTVYCEVSQDIHAGDTVTLTAVSNTADGWIASVSSAGIISSDNSVGIEWEDGVADLSVEKVPFNNLVNNAMFQEGDSPYPLAVGEGSEAIVYTGDSEYPYAYSETCSFAPFTVDGGESVFYLNNATSGTTYTIVANNTTQSFTAEGGGKIAVIKVNNNSIANELTTSVPWIIGTQKIAINQIQRIGTSYYFIIRFTYGTAIYENSFIACFIKKYKNTFYINTALGNYAKATGSQATALGNNAQATGSNATALGNNAKATESQATAIGNNAQATGSNATALGYNAQATGSIATALGNNAQATGSQATAIGYNAKAAYSSGDSTYPRYVVKRFTAIDFIEGGETKKLMFVNYGSSVTISLSGNSITLTPPNQNCKLFIIVNNSVADRIYRSITPYAKVNDIETYINNLDVYDIKTEAVNGNAYYALWMNGSSNNFPSTVSSFSFLAYYKNTSSDSYQISIGHQATAIYNNSIAIGVNTRAVKSGQIVIGAGAIPNEDDKLIIGNGSNTANTKGNILTIDEKEIVHARAYISDAVTYELNGASVSLGTITMGLLKVTGGGALTLTSTNAVEGHCVKVYASGSDITCNGDTITAGKWREYLFLDGAWRSKM